MFPPNSISPDPETEPHVDKNGGERWNYKASLHVGTSRKVIDCGFYL